MSHFSPRQAAGPPQPSTSLPCPICRQALTCDTTLATVRWHCAAHHSFANTGVLLAEIEAADRRSTPPASQPRGTDYEPDEPTPQPESADWSAAGDWEAGLVQDVMATQPWWRDAAQGDGQARVS